MTVVKRNSFYSEKKSSILGDHGKCYVSPCWLAGQLAVGY